MTSTDDSLSPDSRYGNVVVVAADVIGPVGTRTTELTKLGLEVGRPRARLIAVADRVTRVWTAVTGRA